jgi:5-dehydro-4-deoxyglucarate dehydratase
VVYHRGAAQYSVESMRRLAQNPKVVGFKDGTGDVGLAQQIVRAVREAGRADFAFFNGLLTAELTQGAYRGIGIPLYSSAAFAMIPEVANAYYRAYVEGDEERRLALLDGFYSPLVRLRDEVPGFGVSLIKTGLRLGGLPVGGVRAPLVDPSREQEVRLAQILEAGWALLDRLGLPSAR